MRASLDLDVDGYADYDPTTQDESPDHPLLERLGEFFHAR